ncbi:hypothetical protein HQ544_03100 [Candidatus Falkowbacteria bacterium]|nr:hypothetical protein [Candidatus Falkowbacteria bacterium]
MTKFRLKNLIIVAMLAGLTVAVLGCVKTDNGDLEPGNGDEPIVDNGGDLVDQEPDDTETPTTTSLEDTYTGYTSVDEASWETYLNKEYGFGFEYPEYFYISECPHQKFALVLISEDDEDYCSWPKGVRIIIGVGDKDTDLNLDAYTNTKVGTVGEFAYVSYESEIKGGEGEDLLGRPRERFKFVSIPHNDEIITFLYSEVFKATEESKTKHNIAIERNYEIEFDRILQSFQLTN